jgi:hypothetical protein
MNSLVFEQSIEMSSCDSLTSCQVADDTLQTPDGRLQSTTSGAPSALNLTNGTDDIVLAATSTVAPAISIGGAVRLPARDLAGKARSGTISKFLVSVRNPVAGSVALHDREGNVAHQLNAPVPATNSRKRKHQHNARATEVEHSKPNHGSSNEVGLRIHENWSEKSAELSPADIPRDRTLKIDDGGCLFCMVCKRRLNANKVQCRAHLLSDRHTLNLEHKKNMLDDQERMKALISNFISKNSTVRGMSVETRVHEFRLMTVRNYLRSGTPLSQIDLHRSYLEQISQLPLTHSSHLRIYVEMVRKMELDDISELIQRCRFVLVIYDGTTRVDGVFCIVLRFVKTDFTIVQKLATLDRYLKNADHENLVGAVVRGLCKYEIKTGRIFGVDEDGEFEPGQIIGFQRDRCSVNIAAGDYLKRIYVSAKDLGCLSHTLTHIGDHCRQPRLKKFIEDLIGMMNASGGVNKASSHWYHIFGRRWRNPGNTRWWARFELIIFLHNKLRWNQFIEFINTSSEEDSGAFLRRLKLTMSDPIAVSYIKLEISVISIVCKKIIQVSYVLEGDGPCGIIAYDCIMSIFHHLNDHCHDPGLFSESFENEDEMQTEFLRDHMAMCRDELISAHIDNFPSNEAEADMERMEVSSSADLDDSNSKSDGEYGDQVEGGRMAKEAPLHETYDSNIKTYVYGMVSSMLAYFKATIYDDIGEASLQNDVKLYKICRIASPIAMRSDPMSFRSIREEIIALGQFTPSEILDMESDWSKYIRMCNDIPVEVDDGKWETKMNKGMEFWSKKWPELIRLAPLAIYCFTITSSSAAAERVFSRLKNSLSLVQMHSMLEDICETTVMCQYNHNIDLE